MTGEMTSTEAPGIEVRNAPEMDLVNDYQFALFMKQDEKSGEFLVEGRLAEGQELDLNNMAHFFSVWFKHHFESIMQQVSDARVHMHNEAARMAVEFKDAAATASAELAGDDRQLALPLEGNRLVGKNGRPLVGDSVTILGSEEKQ